VKKLVILNVMKTLNLMDVCIILTMFVLLTLVIFFVEMVMQDIIVTFRVGPIV
jgi:hypothetical protein